MVAEPKRLFMKVEDYLILDRNSIDARYEYFDGYAYMMAGGTLDHSTIGLNITSLLRSLLRGGPCRVYNSDTRVRLSEARYAYPDASVSCDPQDRGRVDIMQHPRLIVEVLSPSTEAYDRGRKFAYYRACPGIQEYVLVDAQRQAVEIFRRKTDTFWAYYAFSEGDTVELVSLNLRFPIAAIYEDIEFPEVEPDSSPV